VTAPAAPGHHRPRPHRDRPAGLSDREIAVLRLLARGQSNRDMAEQLYISHDTVKHHVQHIYNKVGVSTRAGAAMFAMEHNLLGQAIPSVTGLNAILQPTSRGRTTG